MIDQICAFIYASHLGVVPFTDRILIGYLGAFLLYLAQSPEQQQRRGPSSTHPAIVHMKQLAGWCAEQNDHLGLGRPVTLPLFSQLNTSQPNESLMWHTGSPT